MSLLRMSSRSDLSGWVFFSPHGEWSVPCSFSTFSKERFWSEGMTTTGWIGGKVGGGGCLGILSLLRLEDSGTSWVL